MAITSYIRGHPIKYLNGEWAYSDNEGSIAQMRPCKKCGELPTPEGYDACLGYIGGIVSACCGHGVEPSYIVWED